MPSAIAYLVDKHGAVHGTHEFHDKNPCAAIKHLNPNIRASTDGRYQYTLATPSDTDFLRHIERLFEID
mgnify:CR=1 FL=1